MSKLLLFDADGSQVREIQLDRERMRVGRNPDSEIHLDDLSVSTEHALVTTIRNDSFIQDLNSMNGVRVNGRLIKHHHLQDGDEISISPYSLKFVYQEWVVPEESWVPPTEEMRQATILAIAPEAGETLFRLDVSSDLGLSRDIADTEVQVPSHQPLDSPTTILIDQRTSGTGHIRLVAGPGTGREAQLARPVTTLGKPGLQTAVISRRGNGYLLTYVEGNAYPQVNGVEVGATPHPLQDHDIIDLAGTRLEFFYR